VKSPNVLCQPVSQTVHAQCGPGGAVFVLFCAANVHIMLANVLTCKYVDVAWTLNETGATDVHSRGKRMSGNVAGLHSAGLIRP
jgi:hypothetical protein